MRLDYEEQEKNSQPGMFLAHTGVLAHHLARLDVNNDDDVGSYDVVYMKMAGREVKGERVCLDG